MQGAIGIIALFIAVPAGLVLTILPTIVAANREHRNQVAILALNLIAFPLWLFAGTFSWLLLCICWVAAFVWACTSSAAVAVFKAVIRATTIAVIRATTVAFILLATLATATAQATNTITGPARVVDGDMRLIDRDGADDCDIGDLFDFSASPPLPLQPVRSHLASDLAIGHGCHEQKFGAAQQVCGRGQSY
jgi:hypothetical protein